MAKTYLIIGSGPAGITAAESIRNMDNDAEITVISEERVPMFYRPRIPEYSVGKISIEGIMVKKKDFYVQKRINLHLGIKATKLDKENRIIETSEGNKYGYDKLLIATGITPLEPKFPGSRIEGVFTMHDLVQAERMKGFVKDAKQVVVVGGGLLGMDMAEEFKAIGLNVTFIVRRDILGDPFFDEYGCKLIHDEFKTMGVEVITNTEVYAFEDMNNRLTTVYTKDGKRFDSDVCFIAIGATHAVDWLKGSSLKIENGVLVDKYLRSHDDDIFSAGNAAQIMDTVFKKYITQTNWINAIAQGNIAGNNMAGRELMKYETTSTYFKRIGTLFFNLLGTGNLQVEGGKRDYFKGGNPKEYIMITMKEGRIIGAVVCGRNKITSKLKEAIEKQREISVPDKLITQEEKSVDDLSKIF
ncbi:MAG: FAD-dependent oxidoreductase [Candidatus Kuenenia sp.]|nr:FAD-dependent oxidoreductase [Candidatus Kuenenia hertensis]